MNAKDTAETIPKQEFYKVSDIMRILNISRSTAYKYIKEKDFPKILLGNSYRISNYRISKQEFKEWYKREMETE